MRRINTFYIAFVVIGISLFFILKPGNTPELSFYGFAESNETKINYNYPVVVSHIYVNPGESVMKGDTLLTIFRLNPKETLADQQFKIARLEAESTIWQQQKQNELSELKLEKIGKLSEIDIRIDALKKELDFKKSLLKDLTSISPDSSTYKPLEDEIKELHLERAREVQFFDLKIESTEKELSIGGNPYSEQIKLLEAEQVFDESHKVQYITVNAPSDGLIGSISCKEAEHIPSYNTLLSFYEPHSGIIKGYVHEDLTLQVNLGDSFTISSLKDPEIKYPGTAIGLGSRIVEIPVRLRKMPNIKSYGREVLIEVSKENSFLQKEKVSVSFISSSTMSNE